MTISLTPAISAAQSPASAPAAAAPVPLVVVASPRATNLAGEISLPATFAPFERVSLHAKLTGYLTDLSADVGDRVKAGQTIARVSIPEMAGQLAVSESRVAAAMAETAKSQANVNLKRVRHDRLAQLLKAEQGAVAELDVEIAAAEHKSAEAELGVARSQVAMAQAELEQLRSMMGYLTIAAPFDGVITQRWQDNGSLVQAAGGKAIFEVMRVDKLRLSFDMPERIVACLSPGQRIRYTVEAMPGRSWEATMTRTAGALRSDIRLLRGEVDVDNSDGRLMPGFYATARLPLGSLRNVAAVPASAVRSAGGQAAVLAVVDLKIKRIPVVVLMDDGKEAAVSGELTEQHLVVVSGPGDLAEGQVVQIKSH
jgi:RND family efflux transporter MFP subunit